MADVAADTSNKGSFVGIASSCNLDRRKQALSKKALDGMTEQGGIPLVVGATHEDAIVDVKAEVGKVEWFWTEGDLGDTLKFSGKLDPSHPDYEFWCSKLDPENEFSFSYKTSIGGWVPKDAIQKTYKDGELIEVLDAFRLDHLLFCRGDAAINQDTAISRGMASPDDWQGAIFYAMASASEDGAEEISEEPAVEETEEPEIVTSDEPLPSTTVEGKADGGSGMPDKVGIMALVMQALQRLGNDEGPGMEDATGMADETISAVVETEVETDKAIGDPPAASPDALGEIKDMLASLISMIAEGAVPCGDACKPKPAAMAETVETETETVAEEVVTETVEETVVEVETEVEVVEEETGKSESALTSEDLDALNATLQSFHASMLEIQASMAATHTRIEQLENRGMASGKSTQVGVAQSTITIPAKKGLFAPFVCAE